MSFLQNSAIQAFLPTGLGIATSIGCHIIFFSSGLSNFAFAQAGAVKQDVVPVIELTESELARLPERINNFSLLNNGREKVSVTNIPSFNNSNLAAIPTPNAEVRIPNNSPSLTYYTNLDQSLLFPEAPQNYVGSSSFTKTTKIPTRVIDSPQRFNNLTSLGNTTQIRINQPNLSQTGNNSSLPAPPPNAILPDKIQPNSLSRTIGGLQATKFPTETSKNQTIENNSENTELQNRSTESATNTNRIDIEEDKPRIVDRQEKLRTQQQVFAKLLRQRQQSLQRDETNTSSEEANNNYLAWLSEVKNTKPNRMSIVGTYPQDACGRRLQGSAVYGVTINGGKATNLKLIQSTGYAILNQQAIVDINNKSFTNLNGVAQVTVTFENSDRVCTGKVVTPNNVDRSTNMTIEDPKVVAPSTEFPPTETITDEPSGEKDKGKENLATPTTESP
jgi:hypothetical protein